jgi:hypothetical protein
MKLYKPTRRLRTLNKEVVLADEPYTISVAAIYVPTWNSDMPKLGERETESTRNAILQFPTSLKIVENENMAGLTNF